MKKFYKESSYEKNENGFAILLDGKPVKTPLRVDLVSRQEKLAAAICAEWNAQDDEIDPDTMPLTQLLNTQIDRIPKERKAMQDMVLGYFSTDLICYFAGDPPELLQRQKKLWQPWLDWIEQRYGIGFVTTFGLSAVAQSNDLHAKIIENVQEMDDAHFTVLQSVVPACGSIALGLAFIYKAIQPQQILECAFIEEDFKAEIYNAEFYGPDPLTDKKKKALTRDLDGAFEYLNSL